MRGVIRLFGNVLETPWLVAGWWLLTCSPCPATTYVANPQAHEGPDYYLTLVSKLRPGDTLLLPAGTYSNRLDLSGLKGTESQWIVITGPESGEPAIITTESSCCNTVQLNDTGHVALKNLSIDANSEGVKASVDGINAKGRPSHNILIENCVISGAGHHQQTVGISTKSMAWNWTVRNNVIEEAGTGAYFGDSDGSAPFVSGVIEGNLFLDSIGYNLQVKHQLPFALQRGMPEPPNKTIIRHNVFVKRIPISKRTGAKVDGARPNLLVGGFASGSAGSNDAYEIYGNFFYTNADNESLIQAEGSVSIHDNILVGPAGTGVLLRDHHISLKRGDIYHNTIFGTEFGIHVASEAEESVNVIGNLVFGPSPITGTIDRMELNVFDAVDNADKYLNRPSFAIGEMDFYPREHQPEANSVDLVDISSKLDLGIDFNGRKKGRSFYSGAYSGNGLNPGWKLSIGRKPIPRAITNGSSEEL